MGINGISQHNSIDWNKIINSVKGEGVSKTSMETGGNSRGLTITNETAPRGVSSFSVSAPKLQTPGDSNTAALNSLSFKLSKENPFTMTPAESKVVGNTTKNLLNEVDTQSNHKLTNLNKSPRKIFDILEVFYLMVEVAKSQREVEKDVKENALQADITSIQNQADEQKTNAMVGLIAGSICTGLSIVNFAYQSAQEINAAKNQANLSSEYGIGDASKNLTQAEDTLSQDMKMLESLENPQLTNNQAAPEEIVNNPANGNPRNQEIADTSSSKSQEVSTEIKNQQNEEVVDQQEEVSQNRHLENVDENNESKIEMQKNPEPNQNEKIDGEADKEQPVVKNENEKVENEDNVPDDNEQIEMHQEKEGEAPVDEKQQKINELKEKIQKDKEDVLDKKQKLEDAEMRMKADPRYTKYQIDEKKANFRSKLGSSLNDLAQTMIKGYTDMEQAEITRQTAVQKRLEAEIGDAETALKDSRDMIDNIIAKIAQVQQSDIDSMKEAIHA